FVLLALAAGPPVPRLDALGDRLPVGAVARLGSARYRHDRPTGVALSPDGKLLAAFGQGGVSLYDPATGKMLRRLKGPVEAANWPEPVFAFSPDGARLVYSGRGTVPGTDTGIAVYNLGADKFERVIPFSEYACMPSFSADGKRLVVGLGHHFSGRGP